MPFIPWSYKHFQAGWGLKEDAFSGLVWDVRDTSSACGGGLESSPWVAVVTWWSGEHWSSSGMRFQGFQTHSTLPSFLAHALPHSGGAHMTALGRHTGKQYTAEYAKRHLGLSISGRWCETVNRCWIAEVPDEASSAKPIKIFLCVPKWYLCSADSCNCWNHLYIQM